MRLGERFHRCGFSLFLLSFNSSCGCSCNVVVGLIILMKILFFLFPQYSFILQNLSMKAAREIEELHEKMTTNHCAGKSLLTHAKTITEDDDDDDDSDFDIEI